MDILEIGLRIGAAALVGVVLGLNRDIHGKSTGVRTLGLVGLAAAAAVMAFGGDGGDTSRIVQGIVTGIGFLGAGVIFHGAAGSGAKEAQAHGLTTAACVWVTACLGATCGAGQWRIVLACVPIILLLLVCGGRFEKAVRKMLERGEGPAHPGGPPEGPTPADR